MKKYKNIFNLIYVVGNEQINHFKIFFKIIKKIFNYVNIKNYLHLFYNSVNFLGNKIKSRNKKNLIFIDDLILKMNKYVEKKIKKKQIKIKKKKKKIKLISICAIKYQFLKINLQKKIDFNFKNSLNLKGNTGIYIQYTYARIYSIFKKEKKIKNIINYKKKNIKSYIDIIKQNEINIFKKIFEYKNIIYMSIKNNDVSFLVNYIYILAKKINNFYQKNKIINNKNINKKNLRLIICKIILSFLKKNMKVLGLPILKKI
ncbi:MAG: DALR anticodon-binding domain-containing protein [Candidatus Shikimatogenerans sp. JK-2022]|nr:DALR anticodon-binding domain-containing protein [Candidatus Shikimatogenerans bostrichidophilus]